MTKRDAEKRGNEALRETMRKTRIRLRRSATEMRLQREFAEKISGRGKRASS